MYKYLHFLEYTVAHKGLSLMATQLTVAKFHEILIGLMVDPGLQTMIEFISLASKARHTNIHDITEGPGPLWCR